MSNFLNSESNTYNIKILSEDDSKIDFSVQEDFLFSLNKKTLQLSSTDDFLEEVIQKLNDKNLKNIGIIIESFSIEYGLMIGDEDKPLYEGQDVFEDENDNNDIKFVDRIRFSYDKFNKDIILNILSFTEYYELCKLSRVSKEWLQLSKDELIWKNLLEKNSFTYEQELGYKLSFIKEMTMTYKWDPEFVAFHLKNSNLGIEDHIQIIDNGLTIDCTTQNVSYWKYVITTKPLQKNSFFALKLEKLRTNYYITFCVLNKEGNNFMPSGSQNAKQIHSFSTLKVGDVAGLAIKNDYFELYLNDVFIQKYDLNSLEDVYPCIALVDEGKVTIQKGWKPK